MKSWDRILQYSSNVLVGGTGVLYGAMRYFMEPADEWAVVNHPWQPHTQHLHVITAPLLVFACGVIWRRHVVGQWKQESQLRRSGPALALMFFPMIVSGYLLQVSVSPGWRRAWVVMHVVSSCVWLIAFGAHLVGTWVRRSRSVHDEAGASETRAPDNVHFAARLSRRPWRARVVRSLERPSG